MTYIDYLNDFNQWLETNALPASSQLMYYKLLHVFNRAGWPEDVGVDHLRLMIMLDGASKTTVIRARDKLVAAGFIEFRKGRKGTPSRYALSIRYKNDTSNDTENDTVSDTKSDTESDTINDTHIKTKTKTKTKRIPPAPLEAEDYGFGPELRAAFGDWLQYKRERREKYKPTGLRSLVTQVRKHATVHGEAEVAELIRQCMASNWQGIIFDRLNQPQPPQGSPRREDRSGNVFKRMLREEEQKRGEA